MAAGKLRSGYSDEDFTCGRKNRNAAPDTEQENGPSYREGQGKGDPEGGPLRKGGNTDSGNSVDDGAAVRKRGDCPSPESLRSSEGLIGYFRRGRCKEETGSAGPSAVRPAGGRGPPWRCRAGGSDCLAGHLCRVPDRRRCGVPLRHLFLHRGGARLDPGHRERAESGIL